MFPADAATSYLSISSKDDPLAWEASFNPANFEIVVPNSIRVQNVMRICPNYVSVPRMFPTITKYNNALYWYQRQVLELPVAGQPDYYLRTVANNWTLTNSIVLPTAQLNLSEILTRINAVTGANEIWTYDATQMSIVITKTPTAAPIAFGVFFDPAHVTPAVSYANMTFVTDLNLDTFDTLGLQKSANYASNQLDKVGFNANDPNTFSATVGSNLEPFTTLPLFQTSVTYQDWASDVYVTPLFNPPNIAGPTTVHVVLQDLGDGTTVSAATGTNYDVLCTMSLANVPFGQSGVKEVRDGASEGIGYRAPRNITSFKVKILDENFRELSLPRNFPVAIRVQLVYVAR